ncbi:MAG: FAD-dependent monooxygenase [Flavobacteriales bacterium]|nr:FAD-dependent monooxygenase [Flavobacteriales bacterium]
MNRWTVCKECAGRGKKKQRIRKSVKIRYEKALDEFKNSDGKGPVPVRPHAHLFPCPICSGSGLLASEDFPLPDHEKFPHVAIIGGGIGGVALAVACLQRGIPFTLYERDKNFAARSQGYGLTLQQASKAIDGFGIFSLDKGVVSTRHLVHTPDGKVVGEWGMRKWMHSNTRSASKRSNVHIARQSLRLALLNQLAGTDYIKWGYQLINFQENNKKGINLTLKVDGKIINDQTDLLVGADGIRSAVRNLLIGEENSPLRYLGCIVILGICPLSALENSSHHLLDSATVFQTANGNERIYVMPYDADSVMWQLSFPMSEEDAKALSEKGSKALKEEAILRTPWHSPIPEILNATGENLISGYPVYDRDLLSPESFAHAGSVTLIGDAAHPMSPFKGQGANQALLDALSLSREIFKNCQSFNWKETELRESILTGYEAEMLERSAIKVKDSAAAAEFLHSEIALYEGDEPRGKVLKRRES